MTDSNVPSQDSPDRFESTDSVLIIMEDRPEAHEVRQPPPWRMKWALAERERILRWGGSLGPPKGPTPPQGQS